MAVYSVIERQHKLQQFVSGPARLGPKQNTTFDQHFTVGVSADQWLQRWHNECFVQIMSRQRDPSKDVRQTNQGDSSQVPLGAFQFGDVR
jgi:hypothetical protein